MEKQRKSKEVKPKLEKQGKGTGKAGETQRNNSVGTAGEQGNSVGT